MNKWSVQSLWNDLITEQREDKPRNYIYASELGYSKVDRILRMRGIKKTNPFTSRTLRVFDCGNIFEIEVMERMFRLLGLFVSTQTRHVVKTPGKLDVVGKNDPRIGGKINYEAAMERINSPDTSEWMKKRAKAVLDKLMAQFPDGLEEVISEIKSVNSQAFWSHKNKDEDTGFFKGYPHHKLQLHTYIKALGIPGVLFYISKDDLTLMETRIEVGDKEIEKAWQKDVAEMTEIYNRSQHEPLLKKLKSGRVTIADWLRPYQEKDIIWNENKQEYEKNWKVLYSGHLTLVTGYEGQDDWEKSVFLELKKANIIPCKQCKKDYTRSTLNKNDGICGRCIKKNQKDAAQALEKIKTKEATGAQEQPAPEQK